MGLSLDEVRHVARLARLALGPEEERRFQEQLSAVLEAFAELTALDVSGVEPSPRAASADGALREDEVRPSLGDGAALRNAPAVRGTHLSVPRILD